MTTYIKRLYLALLIAFLPLVPFSPLTRNIELAELIPITSDNAHDANLLGAFWYPHLRYEIEAVFSPDGTRLISFASSREYDIDPPNLWDMSNLEKVATLASEPLMSEIEQALFSPDNSTVAISNYDDVQLWDVQTMTLRTRLDWLGDRSIIKFTTDSRFLATCCLGGSEGIRLSDITTGKLVSIFDTDTDTRMQDFDFVPNKPLVVTGGFGAIVLQNLVTGDRVGTFRLQGSLVSNYYNDLVSNITITPDGETLIIQDWNAYDMIIHVLDLQTMSERFTLKELPEWASDDIQLSPNGKTLAVIADAPYKIQLIDIESGDVRVELEGSFCRNQGMSYSFTSDNRIVTCHEDTIYFQSAITGDIEIAIPIETEAFAFSPDGTVLATLNCDVEGIALQLWDTHTGTQLQTLPGPCAEEIFFGPDGSTLLTKTDNLIIAYGLPSNSRPALGSVPGYVTPAAINLRSAPSFDTDVIGYLGHIGVVIGGRDESGQFLYAKSHNGWINADPTYIDLYGVSVDSLPVRLE